MGFLGLLGGAVSGGLTSGITKGVGSFVGGLFKKKKNEFQDAKNLAGWQSMLEEDRMNLQAGLNKEQAKYNNELAKQMFDYTMKREAEYNDPKKQMERLKNAGLNPALMYGQGAAGASGTAEGSTAGAGAAQGVTALQPMGLQIALQTEMQKAQIDALNAQTMNTNAQTAKTTTEIENTKSGTELNRIQTAKTATEIDKISMDLKVNTEQLRNQILQNDILDETKEFQIDTAAENYRQLVMQTQKILVDAEMTEKEKEMIQKELNNYDKKLKILEQQADAQTTSAEAAIKSAEAAYKSAEAVEKSAGAAEKNAETNADKATSEKAKNWASMLDNMTTGLNIAIDLVLLKKLKAAGFTLKGAYKVLQKMR